MIDRRNLLKLFGVGTIIAPLANQEAVARIVHPPTVEPVKLIVAPLDLSAVLRATVVIETKSGDVHRIPVSCSWGHGTIDPSQKMPFEASFGYGHTSPMVMSRQFGRLIGEANGG